MSSPTPDRHQALIDELIDSEGSVPHMYQDTAGLVTVGVGECLETLPEARALPFARRADGRAASADEIAADWTAVRQLPAGQLARQYRGVTALELPEHEVHRLLERRVTEFERGLMRQFPDYERLPSPVQMALVDMAFNLGLSGLARKFPKFSAAISSHDWSTAAAESKRRGIGERRNAKVERWLSSVART